MSSPNKILALSLSGIGNFLMHKPLFAALKQHYPHAHLTVWVAPRGTKILALHDPHVDAVIEAPVKNTISRHLRHADRLYHKKYDTGLALYPNQLFKSAAYLYSAGIKTRISHPYPLWHQPNATFLINHAVPFRAELHDIEQNLNLLQPLGIKLDATSAHHYELAVTHEIEQAAYQILADHAIPPSRPLIALHPGSAPGFEWKRWPRESFAALIQQLVVKHNAHLLILGGPAEEKLKQSLKVQINNHESHIAVISTDLLTTAALLQKCRLVISNDSGLMHLAAASGAKTLGLFGPTDEKKVGPRGKQSFTIRAPGTKAVYDVNNNFSFGPNPHPSMRALTIEDVVFKISELI